MSESLLEISSQSGELSIPDGICCNCAREDRVATVDSELKVTRYFGMGGSEYTFTWGLPFCRGCEATAARTPINKLHVLLVIGVVTVSLFLLAIIAQMLLERSLLGGHDFWVSLAAASALVGAYYATRKPEGAQTSYYQPVRIRKLRQKFSSGEVTGIVLAFTNGAYMRRFREANAASLRS